MAYGLKYTHTFQQLKSYSTNGEWLINIYEDGYGGSSLEFNTLANSIKLERSGELDDVIRPTTLSFDIYNETEGAFLDFSNAVWGHFKVELIFDPNGTPITKFVGYNQTEIYTEPLEQTPYPSTIKFTCGLKHLQYVRWDDSGTLYDGQKSIIEVLRLGLNKLPSPLGIREFLNVYEDSINSSTTDSMLNQIYVDSTLYKELIKKSEKEEGDVEAAFMVYNVIESIFKPLYVHIYQSNGLWYLFRKQEYKDSTNYYRNFNANIGSENIINVDGVGFFSNLRTITNNNNNASDIILPSASAEKEVSPPVNRVKVTYKQQNLEFAENKLVKNGSFNQLTLNPSDSPTSNGSPTFWTEGSGLDTTTYRAFSPFALSNIVLGANKFEFDPSSYKSSESLSSTKYIQYFKSNVPVAITDSISFSFRWFISLNIIRDITKTVSIINNYTINSLKLVFEVQFKIGSYYLVGNWGENLTWGTTQGNIKFQTTGLGNNFYVVSIFSEQNKEIAGEFSDIFPTLPETGLRDVEVRFYEPYTDIPSYSSSDSDHTININHIKIATIDSYYLPDEIEPVEEQIIYAEINEDENFEEIDVIHGDGTSTISQGSYRLSSGVITDNWSRRSVSESQPILRILLDSIRQDRGDYYDIINGILIGEFEVYNRLRMTIGTVTKDYIINTYTYNIENNEWDVSLHEVNTFSNPITLTDGGVITTVVTSVPTNTTGGTIIGTVVDTTINETIVVQKGTTVIANQVNLSNFN